MLLDENLLNMLCSNPLYVRRHSKDVLVRAAAHDTRFLTEQSIMDYSLLVGIDDDTNELVLGIIGESFYAIKIIGHYIILTNYCTT